MPRTLAETQTHYRQNDASDIGSFPSALSSLLWALGTSVMDLINGAVGVCWRRQRRCLDNLGEREEHTGPCHGILFLSAIQTMSQPNAPDNVKVCARTGHQMPVMRSHQSRVHD